MPPLMKLFFWFGAIGPLPSIVLYIFLTAGTVEHFNGEVTETSLFWCSTNAAADATISYLCFSALFTRHVEIHKLVLRAFAVYAIFHWGSFWWWSVHGKEHPLYLEIGYPVSIGISLAAMVYWTVLKPPAEWERYDGPSPCEDVGSSAPITPTYQHT
jgi:hypothetical protein